MKNKTMFGFLKYSLLMLLLVIGTFTLIDQAGAVRVEASFNNSSAIEVKNQEGQLREIKKAMEERKGTLVLKYVGDYKDLINGAEEILYKVFDFDGPEDYLKLTHKGIESSTSYTLKEAEITYKFTYLETAKETKAVDTKAKEILKKLDLESKSDYQKIKTIHDYIVNLVSYDKTLTKYSAYNALVDKSSTCQGYALLTYKMLTEAGIPCRIITGTAGTKNPVSHAWNLVKLQGKWYNLDTTWDDPVTSTGKNMLTYNYFLKSTKDFTEHTRDKEYKTAEFMKKYPVSTKSFTKAMDKGK